MLHGKPEVGRITAQRLAKETGRRNPDDGDGVAVDDEIRADDPGIGSILLLPGAVAQHGNGRRRRLIVSGNNGSSSKGADTEGLEIIAADVFAAQRLRLKIAIAAA